MCGEKGLLVGFVDVGGVFGGWEGRVWRGARGLECGLAV